ncbi:MAG: CarD family transcriptional regulator [Niameybacter sp.]|uniref:CarD family transcriptional regulator n=1 Tax=Niameybacter sp. TaxID=2033640 RepID=UPI002FC91507
MFEVGDYIVYGSNNVCKVEEIGKMDFQEPSNEREYYLLVPIYAPASKVFTPTDNNKVAMRPVMTPKEAWALLDEVKDIEALEIADFRRKEETYKQAMRSCKCREWVKVIKMVYGLREERKAEGKKMTASDEKYFNLAKEELNKELAFVLNMPKEEVEPLILEKIKLA